MSLDEFVEALKREGITRHPGTIRQAETGYTNLGFKVVNAAARVLGVPREEIILTEAKAS